ncbi:alpha/beta hydrolase [Streptomyces sp. NPDC048161]|jgi:pimeloyl-ACP methyl ester carboxylesterase|uniref:alpha/beta fold hydrolase n=1 Tax=unclassified Streptomyces TaxID=2593676 RepID=UPI00081BBD0B|nr:MULTISPECIES: alpha/beta hydrolase [unclassified Streptomyces]MYQ85021.1 alpha/beta fold hydrolase [Streptomyces sp. SID4936]SCD96900.1 Pimeloyl-ACP methyl ester carboxylesterase [Streptomyces sp. DvalAA-43]
MADEIIRTLSVDGLRYGYRVLRQPSPRTEPVIILGGALQGMYGWPQMDDHLGPLTSVVTADLPGMGDADPLPPGAGDDVLYDAVTGIIDDLDVPRVNLFGFSYGTSIAFGCARRHPGRIARLILGGVPAHISDAQRAEWSRAVARLDTGDLEGLAGLAAGVLMCQDPERRVHRGELARRYVRRSFLYALTHSPHAARSLHRALARRPDFSGGLAGVPALVFAGEHDTVTSPERQRDFAATIEGSRFVTIGESDHWVVLERPDDVADLAARFFTDRPLESAPGLAALPAQSRTSRSAAGPDFADLP